MINILPLLHLSLMTEPYLYMILILSLKAFSNARTIPFKEVDVRKLGDVEGCYAAGPEKVWVWRNHVIEK